MTSRPHRAAKRCRAIASEASWLNMSLAPKVGIPPSSTSRATDTGLEAGPNPTGMMRRSCAPMGSSAITGSMTTYGRLRRRRPVRTRRRCMPQRGHLPRHRQATTRSCARRTRKAFAHRPGLFPPHPLSQPRGSKRCRAPASVRLGMGFGHCRDATYSGLDPRNNLQAALAPGATGRTGSSLLGRYPSPA